jgi:transposase
MDLNGITKLLIFGRILRPDSKLSTFEERDRYQYSITHCAEVEEVYNSLDFLHDNSECIQNKINNKIVNMVGRNAELCYYDVTNFFFQIGKNDEDEVDQFGKIIKKGLRKKGFSKENRRNPIVQMGLFIDDNGLPIAYKIFPGNTSDQNTLRSIIDDPVVSKNYDKVIVIADGGVNGLPNRNFLLGHGHGYIVPKSPKVSDKGTKKWVTDDEGYTYNKDETFKVKSKLHRREYKDENGETKVVTEKMVAYWSKKHDDKETADHRQIEQKVYYYEKHPNELTGSQKVKKFLLDAYYDEETGEIIETGKRYIVDTRSVQEKKLTNT